MNRCLLLLIALIYAGLSSPMPSIPVHIADGRVYMQVIVNGKGPYTFQLDTERADVGRISFQLAQQLGLNIVGYEEITDVHASKREFLVNVDHLTAGMISHRNQRLIVGDFSHPAGQALIDGLLGRGFFQGRLLVFEGPSSQLTLGSNSLTPPDSLALPYTQPFVVSGAIGSRPARFNLNTGVAPALLFRASQLMGLAYTNTANRVQVTMGKGTFWLQEALLQTDVALGTTVLKKPLIYYSDKINQISLGVGFWKTHRLTIDQKTRRVWID